MNVVVLLGTLSRDPVAKDLPSGDRVLSLDVTSRVGDRPADSVPVAWFDPPPRASTLVSGDVVVVVGRVRRRFFRTPGGTQSRTEVVAERVIPQRQRKASRSAVDQAWAEVAATFGDGAVPA